MSTQTLRLVIHGRVQGVWFRESMKQQAEQLGITGWVMNRADGCVEAVIQGNETALAAMVDWTRVGPSLARVTQVEQFLAEDEAFADFRKLSSA
jgi:acylphosphatase